MIPADPWLTTEDTEIAAADGIIAAAHAPSALARRARPAFLPPMVAPAQSEHAREADARQAAIYRAMTPRQRLEQALRMNAAMRRLLALGFRHRHPGWTETQIRRAVADRILHARTG